MDSDDEVSQGSDLEKSPRGTKRPHEDSENEADEPNEEYDKHQQCSSQMPHRPETNSFVVAQHYNKLEEKGLAERFNSKIFYLRNFNNWVKSMLISDYLEKIRDSIQFGSPLRVLDICCGKGGDLLKWQKGNITHLICTDIAQLSIEQCEARYNKITQNDPPNRKSFKAEFFTADATRDRLRHHYKDPSIALNLVSCQFAFHYCFESPRQANMMMKNVSECLRVGGYFIGTIPDAFDIMKRQQRTNSDTFGNDIYHIKFLSDPKDLPIFGAKYNFHLNGVVDCPEFLVYFPAFVKLAEKYNLKLVESERFEAYFDKKIRRGRGLLDKMNAVERYGVQDNRNLSQSDQQNEYKHASEFLKRKEAYSKKCGTLSSSEWEAVSLYMMFAFQKIKKPTD